jgi:hypothetical protein
VFLLSPLKSKTCDVVTIAERKCRRHSPGANRRAGLLELAVRTGVHAELSALRTIEPRR